MLTALERVRGMKTYMCDICGTFVNDPRRMVYMREIQYRGKDGKKKRVHLCDRCLDQMAMISLKKDGADNE